MVKMRFVGRIALYGAAAVALASCDAARDPVSVERPMAAARPGPLCQLGCQPPVDSEADAPGIRLEGIDPGYCSSGTDTDLDGLNNFCEKQLSFAFRPLLAHWSGDDVRREPYWAARQPAPGMVVIAYLLSYYNDLGAASHSGCWNSYGWLGLPPFFQDVAYLCNGHNGDSEWIILTLTYNGSTQHWVLNSAMISAHEHVHYAWGYELGYADLEYPDREGGYPRVYVSQKKHANYFTRSACNNGGPVVPILSAEINTDDCGLVDSEVRLEWSNWFNIGSNSSRLIDCVQSRSPGYEYYGSGRQECLWSSVDFRGWVPDGVGGGHAGRYGDILRSYLF